MSLEAPSNNRREGAMLDRFRNEIEVLPSTVTSNSCELLARGNTIECSLGPDKSINLVITRGDHSEPLADWQKQVLKEFAAEKMAVAIRAA